jgi:hypothetical protein
MMKKIVLVMILCTIFSCNQTNKQIEYYDTGEKFKETEFHKNGDIKINYFDKDGLETGEVFIVDNVEMWIFRYENGQIYEKGIYTNGVRKGWHNFYYEDGRKMSDVFFINGQDCQIRKYNEDGSIDKENSIYTEIHLPTDTLKLGKEMLGYLRYFNGSSAKEQVYVYLSNEIDDKFSNLNTVAVDTFMSGSKDIDTYFSVKFNNKGKNYIRGYLIDIVSNKKSLQNKDSLSTGLRVLFEKEVYVR